LVLASAELLFELPKFLLLLLDLLEAQVGFELDARRMQVELRSAVEDGGLRLDELGLSASADRDSFFKLSHPGDNSPHRIDLAGELLLELLGVGVQALLSA
jgi:hypothetical protein